MNRLFHISSEDFWHQINGTHSTKGGVYKLIAILEGERIPINRFLETDRDGVLYIGKANTFLDRTINLKKSILPSYIGSNHHCGVRYKANPNIAEKFPSHCLYIELFESDNPSALERDMLTNYISQYGEVPPLNSNC